MSAFLIGGGWTPEARPLVYGPFLQAAGTNPEVACVVLDEGDGPAEFDRWAEALTSTAPCTPRPVLVPEGDVLDVASLGDAAGVLVCGGLTPAYAAALAPRANVLAMWLEDGKRPYAGFSAGGAIAAREALVGGWQANGVPVCPDDVSEDLDEITVVPGLGLVPFTVEVHAAQWGTLNRLIASVRSGRVGRGIAIDEDTMITVDGHTAQVSGLGLTHVVSASAGTVEVRSSGAGQQIDIGAWEA